MMRIRDIRMVTISLMAFINVACMANPITLNLEQQSQRFTLNSVALGAGVDTVLQQVKDKLSQEPDCKSEKVGGTAQRRAHLKQTCQLNVGGRLHFAGHLISDVQYIFYDKQLLQMDLKITPQASSSFESIAAVITEQLEITAADDLTGLMWAGENDIAMLQQQGDILLRIVNRSIFDPDTPRKPVITNRGNKAKKSN